MAQAAEHLSGKCKALSSNPQYCKKKIQNYVAKGGINFSLK
jgi:hypothetical protein